MLLCDVEAIVESSLKEMKGNYYCPSSFNLVLGTCAQETHLGRWRKQVGGPALGLFGYEEPTFNWIKEKYSQLIDKMFGDIKFADIEFNDHLAVVMCRLRYAVVTEPLPAPDNISGMARYWKEYYNTDKGRGSEIQFIENYTHYVTLERS